MDKTRTWTRLVAALAMVPAMALAPAAPALAGDKAGDGAKRAPVELTLEQMLASDYVDVGAPVVVGGSSSAGFSAAGYTWTGRSSNSYKSLVGLTVIRHNAITVWSGTGGGTIWSSPRSLADDISTVPPNFMNNHGYSWDWYNACYNCSAQSNHRAQFTFGIPTPWGGIGSTTVSRILLRVNGWGGISRV